MSEGTDPSKRSVIAAEQVLRKIYGDDFTGCTVTLDSIAKIIDDHAGAGTQKDKSLIQVLTKVMEAVQFLSTPPPQPQVQDAAQLGTLLGERLDGIRDIATKALEAISSVNPDSERQP
jgi:hypothetical protein